MKTIFLIFITNLIIISSNAQNLNIFNKQECNIIKNIPKNSEIIFENIHLKCIVNSLLPEDVGLYGEITVNFPNNKMIFYKGFPFISFSNLTPYVFKIDSNKDNYLLLFLDFTYQGDYINIYSMNKENIEYLGRTFFFEFDGINSINKLLINNEKTFIELYNNDFLKLRVNLKTFKKNPNMEKWYGLYKMDNKNILYYLLINKDLMEFSGYGDQFYFNETCSIKKVNNDTLQINFWSLNKSGYHGHNDYRPLVKLYKLNGKYFIESEAFLYKTKLEAKITHKDSLY